MDTVLKRNTSHVKNGNQSKDDVALEIKSAYGQVSVTSEKIADEIDFGFQRFGEE
jgi:hypothetical protein